MEDNNKPLRGKKRTSVTAVEQNKSVSSNVSKKKKVSALTIAQLRAAAKRPSVVVIVAPPGSGKTTLLRRFNQMNELYDASHLGQIICQDADDHHAVADVYQQMRNEHGSGWWAKPEVAIFRHPAMAKALRMCLDRQVYHCSRNYSVKQLRYRDAVVVTAETRVLELMKDMSEDNKADFLFVPWLPPHHQHQANMLSRRDKAERGPVWLDDDLIRNRDYFFRQYQQYMDAVIECPLPHVAYSDVGYAIGEAHRHAESLFQFVMTWLEKKRRNRAIASTDYHIARCEHVLRSREREVKKLRDEYDRKRNRHLNPEPQATDDDSNC